MKVNKVFTIFIFLTLAAFLSLKQTSHISAAPPPTSTPAPTPNYWYKLKNTSFYKYFDLQVAIPSSVNKFDNDDDNKRLFDTGDAGVVAAAGASIYFKEAFGENIASTHGWRIANYIKKTGLTPKKFLEYVKSRKSYVQIKDVNDIQKNQINVYTGSLTISDNGISGGSRTPFVLIVDGDLTINVGQKFNNSGRSLAMMATGTLNITSTTEEINGVFIGQNIDLTSDASSTINPLKIKGNLVLASDTSSTSTALDTTSKRRRSDSSKPSVFAMLDLTPYIELLPLLSTRSYTWSELK